MFWTHQESKLCLEKALAMRLAWSWMQASVQQTASKADDELEVEKVAVVAVIAAVETVPAWLGDCFANSPGTFGDCNKEPSV